MTYEKILTITFKPGCEPNLKTIPINYGDNVLVNTVNGFMEFLIRSETMSHTIYLTEKIKKTICPPKEMIESEVKSLKILPDDIVDFVLNDYIETPEIWRETECIYIETPKKTNRNYWSVECQKEMIKSKSENVN